MYLAENDNVSKQMKNCVCVVTLKQLIYALANSQMDPKKIDPSIRAIFAFFQLFSKNENTWWFIRVQLLLPKIYCKYKLVRTVCSKY